MTVVESCRLIQGPLASHVLRLLGARVIKIEPPGGDPMRGMPPLAGEISAHFNAINHGKDSVELDLKSPADRARLLELARDADVFLHNWAPGRAAQLRLAAEDFARVAPGLIYAAASGAGPMPDADNPMGTDFLMQAHCGIASLIRQPGHGAQARGGALLTLVDVLGGVAAAEGVVAALHARQQDGRARHLDSAMAGAAALLMASEIGKAAGAPADPYPINPALGLPAVFATRDGHLMLDAAGTPAAAAHLAWLCKASVAPKTDAPARLAAVLATRDSAHWCQDFAAHGVGATPVAHDARAVAAHPLVADGLRPGPDCLQLHCPWTITP